MPQVDLHASNEAENNFGAEVGRLVQDRDFRALERMAKDFAASKERFIGGGWKLYSLYSCSSPAMADTKGKRDWPKVFEFFEEWKQRFPASTMPRALLADEYVRYAWEVRGDGYADKVPKEVWPVFHSRLAMAETELRAARSLDERDHHYYYSRIGLARALDLDPAAQAQIFREAIEFAPEYQYFYTDYAVSLTERWGGRPGELKDFAAWVKDYLGPDKGLLTYYSITAEIGKLHNFQDDLFRKTQLSWEDAKEGFRLTADRYGVNTLRINEFGRLAMMARDTRASCAAFKHLGEHDYDPLIWNKRPIYDAARQAAAAMCRIR